MVDEKHVLFTINDIADNADEDTIRYLEEKICPVDHTFVMQKLPTEVPSIITGNNPPGIQLSQVSLNNFVEQFDTIILTGGIRDMADEDLYLNIYKCPICGRYYKGDIYQMITNDDGVVKVKYPSDERIKEIVEKYNLDIEKIIDDEIIDQDFFGEAYKKFKEKKK